MTTDVDLRKAEPISQERRLVTDIPGPRAVVGEAGLALVGAHLDDLAGQLVPRDVRPRNGRVVPAPRVPVAAAHAARPHPDDRTVRRAHRRSDPLQPGRRPEPLDHDCAHRHILARLST